MLVPPRHVQQQFVAAPHRTPAHKQRRQQPADATEKLRKAIVAKALPVLVAALERFPDQEQLHVQCLDAFTDMFGGHGADCARFANAGVLAAVVSTMKASHSSSAVIEGAAMLLRKASECSLLLPPPPTTTTNNSKERVVAHTLAQQKSSASPLCTSQT